MPLSVFKIHTVESQPILLLSCKPLNKSEWILKMPALLFEEPAIVPDSVQGRMFFTAWISILKKYPTENRNIRQRARLQIQERMYYFPWLEWSILVPPNNLIMSRKTYASKYFWIKHTLKMNEAVWEKLDWIKHINQIPCYTVITHAELSRPG